jgi:DNA-binding response OmpR family regulator
VQPRQIEVLRFDDVALVPSQREASRDGDPARVDRARVRPAGAVPASSTPGALRERILQDVWGFDYLGDSNLVDVRIKYLRDKLELGGRSRLIQTVRGAGYALRV